MRRSSSMLALYLAVVFVSGALVGAFSYRLYSTEISVKATDRRRGGPEEWRRRFVSEAEKRLSLSEEQLAEFNAILDRTKERFDEVDANVCRPAKRAVHEEQSAEISAMLDDSQRAEYTRWREERAEKRRKDREKRDGRAR